MTPEPARQATQPDRYRDRATVTESARNCSGCGQNSTCKGVSLCERCLFSVAIEVKEEGFVSPAADQPTLPRTGRRLGCYILLEEIGRGGMGVIFRALHEQTNEIVAVKTVLPEDVGNQEVLERFRREAVAAQSLDHPHSMPILGTGCSDEGIPFFSMKLAVAGSLHQLGAKYRGRWRQIASLLIKIAGAVHHAHERGIVHRDLKPGNILFDEKHEPLVTDFGLARRLTSPSDLTQTCSILGTPSYVSPEQAAGRTRSLTRASDIYSLGAIMFELLTGRPPFVGETPLDVLRQAAENTPSSPRSIVRSVPRALDIICMRCLEHTPEDRYASAKALADDLERCLDGQKISPRPVLKRFWKGVSFGVQCMSVLTIALLTFCVLWINIKRSQPQTDHVSSIALKVDTLELEPALDAKCDLLTRSLGRELSGTVGLQVRDGAAFDSRSVTDVVDPLQFGRAAKADLMMEANLRISGSKLRIVTRLLRCETGAVVWRNTLTLPSDQPSSGMSDAASGIVKALRKKWNSKLDCFPSPYEPSPDAAAFFTKAMELTSRKNRRDLDAAVGLLQRSCELEPRYAEAHAMLAFALFTQADSYREVALFPVAMSKAEEALKLEPDSCAAHRVVAACYLRMGRREDALNEFYRGVELNPHSPGCVQALGVCLREIGQARRAIPWLVRATQLAPARGAFSASLGETLGLCGMDDKAEEALRRAAELDQDRPDALVDTSVLRTWQRNFTAARQLCADARKRFPECRYGGSLQAWIDFCGGDQKAAETSFLTLRRENTYQQNWDFFGAVNPSSALAYLAKCSGLIDQAQSFAQEAIGIDSELLERYPGNPRILHDLAATFSAMGNREQAESYLQKAVSTGWIEYRSTEIDPRFSSLAATPHFQDLLRTTSPSLQVIDDVPRVRVKPEVDLVAKR